MRLTERNKRTPSGLARFLDEHEDCPKGFEILRDSSLVTVVCRGCESSFSYLTEVAATEPTEVERALGELADGGPPRPEEPPAVDETEASSTATTGDVAADHDGDAGGADRPGPDRFADWRRERRLRLPVRPHGESPPPAANGSSAHSRPDSNGAAPVSTRRAPRRAARLGTTGRPTAPAADAEQDSSPPPGRPHRLPPPGPHATERKKVLDGGLRELALRTAGVVDAVNRRRRPIALAAMSLAGAYVLLALSTGSEPGASDTGNPLRSAELPLEAAPPGEAEEPVAGDARTLETLEGGGPDAATVEGGAGRFELVLPPGWDRGSAGDGSDLYRSASGEAEVLIKVETGSGVGLGTLADRGAAFLAMRLSPGAEVQRTPAREQGEVLAVARSSGGDRVQTAYVASADDTQYLVVLSHDDNAPALDRLQAEGIVRSFETTGAKTAG